jgi:hypothetical protein
MHNTNSAGDLRHRKNFQHLGAVTFGGRRRSTDERRSVSAAENDGYRLQNSSIPNARAVLPSVGKSVLLIVSPCHFSYRRDELCRLMTTYSDQRCYKKQLGQP